MSSHLRLSIQSHGEDFLAAVVGNGLQLFFAELEEGFVSFLEFNKDGDLISSDTLEASRIVRSNCEVQVFGQSPPLAARLGTIEVKPFSDQASGIGIELRPECYAEFLNDPDGSEPDVCHRERMFAQIVEWDRSGRFVLWAGKDYWMNADGSVYAT